MAVLDRTKADPWVLKTPPGTAEYSVLPDPSGRCSGACDLAYLPVKDKTPQRSRESRKTSIDASYSALD